jgi:phage-related tail protein
MKVDFLLLKKTFDESTTTSTEIEKQPENIEEWSIFYWIETKYNHQSDGDKYIAGFILDLEEDLNEIIQEFGKKLQDDENIDLVLKYGDEGMQVEYQKYAKEIFDLEMRLREVISFIFLDTYKGDHHNLLSEFKVKIQPLNKNYKPNEEYCNSHFENEFFFLLFSDYIKLNELKELKQPDLMEIIINSNDYDNLKQKIQSRGIIKKEYQDFLAGIKQNLEPIENIRNCIAHNRSFTDTTIENYVEAKKNLEGMINEFWDGIQNED